MDREFKRKWVTALRSGIYPQGKFALRNNNNFCCLGVAADLYDPAKWVADGKGNKCIYSNEAHTLTLPKFVKTAIKLDNHHENHLSNMNDAGRTFKEIADWIEKTL